MIIFASKEQNYLTLNVNDVKLSLSLGGMDFKYLHSLKLVLHLYLQICNFIFQPTFCLWPLAQKEPKDIEKQTLTKE